MNASKSKLVGKVRRAILSAARILLPVGAILANNANLPVWSAMTPEPADHDLSSKEKPWFLQEQYEKSKKPQLETLLSPLPELSKNNQIKVTPPEEKELVPIGFKKLNPLRLEATISRSITLSEILDMALQKNLAIKVSQDTLRSNRYSYLSSLGKFLPDLSMTWKVQDMYQNNCLTNQFTTRNMTIAYAWFQGGKVYYNSLANFFNYRAARYSLQANRNDVLLNVYKLYNNVLYNQVLLHIRLKSLESSRGSLHVTEQQYSAGTGTHYAVMQSKTQVASDTQALVAQEATLRKANIDLAAALNQSLFENYQPDQVNISKKYLISPRLDMSEAVSLTMSKRPELKQYYALCRQASANAGQQAAALLPTAQLFFTPGNTSVYMPGQTAGAGSGSGSSPSSVNLSTTGAGTTSVGLGNAVGTSISIGGTVSWNLAGLGTTDTANTLAAKALARRSLNQYNQQVVAVMQELHKSFIDVQTAEQQIEITGENVEASRESLRLALIRLKVGNGTNLEYIQSQKTYVDALTSQAKSYIDFLNAQAQLLRDTGTIDAATLVRGYSDGLPQEGS